MSLDGMMHTQDTKLEWPLIQCISVKPLLGLSGAQRRVVRSRDTDTKAPGGYRQHTRPLTSSSWPRSEQLSRYLAVPLAMAGVGPEPRSRAQHETRPQARAGVRQAAARDPPAGEGRGRPEEPVTGAEGPRGKGRADRTE